MEPGGADQALSGLSNIAQVTQIFPPRLALVLGEKAALEAVPGVVSVHDSAIADLPTDLTDHERRFVAAWRTRTGAGGVKKRFAEGLNWDAPGFEPPDAPPGHG
jgi:hypothetical protein